METATMGKVVVKAKIENINDALNAKAGIVTPDKVRSVEVDDALVDTGAKFLSLPSRLIRQLGLSHVQTRQAITSIGIVPCEIYGPVRLTIEGRQGTIDVAEVSDDCPVLIGYFPLELLDFVVDPVNRKVIGRPEHGGQWVLDLL